MNTYYSKIGITAYVLIFCTLMFVGCKKREDATMKRSENRDKSIYIVEANITEKIEIPSPESNDFVMFKCVVTDPLESKIPKGDSFAFVIPKVHVAKKDFTQTEIKAKNFDIGNIYRLTVTFAMPKGWDALKEEFDDERCFIMACLRIEDAGVP